MWQQLANTTIMIKLKPPGTRGALAMLVKPDETRIVARVQEAGLRLRLS